MSDQQTTPEPEPGDTAAAVRAIREQMPEGYEILPIGVIETLIYAGYAAYLPAFGGSEKAVSNAHNAARAAENVLARRRQQK